MNRNKLPKVFQKLRRLLLYTEKNTVVFSTHGHALGTTCVITTDEIGPSYVAADTSIHMSHTVLRQLSSNKRPCVGITHVIGFVRNLDAWCNCRM